MRIKYLCSLSGVFATALIIFTLATYRPATAAGGTYYVDTGGNNAAGVDGSAGNPWATIQHALENVPDGSIIIVRSGTYAGQIRLSGTFPQGVLVKAETPYQAKLTHNRPVIITYDADCCRGITIEGFEITHSLPLQSDTLIHLDGGGSAKRVSYITLRNNILHDSYDNDIIKVNNAIDNVLIEGNMFYNQAGSDEHIDANSATNVTIQDNIFFNDFAGSGRPDGDTSSFVVIKDSNGNDDNQLGSEHVTVRRNVFLHWEGSSGQGFVRIGEDGTNNYEAKDVLVENNLMLGNNSDQIRSPFQVMGSYSITIRANTVAGNMPAKEFGARIFTYGANQNNNQIHLHNNIWSDPTGTMGDTFNRGNNTTNLTFDNNLFWNNGNPFPTSSESIIEVSDDANRVIGNPLLGNQSGLVLPRWVPGSNNFNDGSTSIQQAFERLVRLYGVPANTSPAVDGGDPTYAPTEDILGQSRLNGTLPDIGAYELPSLTGVVGDKTIRLTWKSNPNISPSATWQISYIGPVGNPPSPVTSIISPTRIYTLTGLTNYVPYSVTLKLMVSGTPVFTYNTVSFTPTDRFVYLPVIIK